MRAPLRRLLSILGATVLAAGAVLVATPASAGPTDTTPPVLRSVSVAPGPYVPGQTVTWTFDIVDESAIAWLDVVYATPSSAPGFFHAQIVPPAGWRTGALSWTIPSTPTTAPHDGSYEATTVWIGDTSGATARYVVGGRLVTSPPTQTTHTVDLRAPLTITGSPRDIAPPALTAFTPPASAEYGLVHIPYAASDQTSLRLDLHGRREGGDETHLGELLAAPAQGVLMFDPRGFGVIELTRVVVTDANGNSSTYFADGSVTRTPAGGPATHAFSIGRISVVPPPVEHLSASTSSGAATITWAQLSLAGHRVTVEPGNRVITGGPTGTTDQTRTLRITGLQNGVDHTITVTPTSTGGDGRAATVTVRPRMSTKVFGTGDRSGDGRADLWATGYVEATSDARWLLYTGAGGGRFGRTLRPTAPYAVYPGFPGSTTGRGPGAPTGSLHLQGSELRQAEVNGGSTLVGRGFDVFRTIDASSDLTSDGVADLIGITPAGDFYLYTASSTGAIGRGVRLGGGWGSFHAVFSPGDFSGDRRADLVAVDGAGTMWLYPGNGFGGFGRRVQIGTGWAGFGSVFPMRDFSGDGKVDIGAITTDGRLLMYPGNGRSGFLAKAQIGTGWGMFL
ncbi:hypothetical protein N798_13505 [Knoellia flava TL1]|uniref:Fibronectin type-III domain-containing protein n=2 Tax=Knoellia flava TaxID=913969 RepID=A0A8H9FTZ4_9MICO|nr:VCBS repeat-containing protein [Knoellia flava]KGN29623.1 hypothetical protein N798_13505 [Knoellia flava TL1]GGB75571.1 hypothetical protein GCM10011314_13900 [Knoellia flava]